MDGFFYAGVNLSDFDVCRLPSCVRPFDAVDITADLDEVRTLGPNQTSELISPDSALKIIKQLFAKYLQKILTKTRMLQTICRYAAAQNLFRRLQWSWNYKPVGQRMKRSRVNETIAQADDMIRSFGFTLPPWVLPRFNGHN